MVSSQFGLLLKEFEPFFGCDLLADENNSCLIRLVTGLHIQIEMDRSGQILIGCRLGPLFTGRYRDSLIKQAMKSNDAGPLSSGIFGFSQKSRQLILFTKLDPATLTRDRIGRVLPAFVNKAKIWKEAIEQERLPPIESAAPTTIKSGLFSLIS